ncbi:hypothetical protein C8Q74DRAFT_1445067 [Fomes fomentarius]|nr:hypothetical protein C8Q74DRAFT_1445067 [Fomes fomentarius]
MVLSRHTSSYPPIFQCGQHAPCLRDSLSGIHLTIFTKATYEDTLSTPGLRLHLHVAGVGGSVKAGVVLVGVIWCQTLQKRVGRKPKSFHITLPEHEDYTADKGYDSILPDYPVPPLSGNVDILYHLTFTIHIERRFDHARMVALDLCKAAAESLRGFLRLGDAALKEERYKLAMLRGTPSEWLVVTHAIAYSRLPDWFMAFDLYDRSLDRWADRLGVGSVVGGYGDQQPSRFYEGPVEEVYVKVEKGGRVVSRGKVVRADFIAGNEHWSKGPLRLNALSLSD